MRKAGILMAGAAAALPSSALTAQSVAAQSGTANEVRFAPPEGELVLTRVVHRALSGGHEILARRSYAVRIVPEGSGFRVEGRLIDSQVEAPASLAPIAELERRRPDVGLFPLRLDASGRLVDRAAPVPDPVNRRGAELVLQRVAQSTFGPEEKAAANKFVAGLTARGSNGGEWPHDLFRPQSGQHKETRRIPLPGGGEGTVTVAVTSRTAAGSGLLEALERTVTADLGGETRETREEWSLTRRVG